MGGVLRGLGHANARGLGLSNNRAASGGDPGDPYNEFLKLWLPMSSVGTVFADSSVSNHSLTTNGNAQITLNSGPGGNTNAGVFDGTGDFLEMPKDADFDFGVEDFAITLDYYTGSASNDCSIIGLNLPYVGETAHIAFAIHHFGTTLGTGQLRGRIVRVSSDYTLDSGNVVVANTWHTIKMYRAGETFGLKVDGVIKDTRPAMGSIDPNVDATHVLRIGKYSDGAPFWLNGRIANVKIYNGSSAGEV